MTADHILEKLDVMLDDVEELIRQLPLTEAQKKQLCSACYGLWMDVEEMVEEEMSLKSTDFG
jgi:hypothetical protein